MSGSENLCAELALSYIRYLPYDEQYKLMLTLTTDIHKREIKRPVDETIVQGCVTEEVIDALFKKNKNLIDAGIRSITANKRNV